MAITALPTPPNRNMTPEEFIAAADAFLEALPTFQSEANAAAEAMNLNDTSGTSATSNSIGTGAKTFTANTGKSWLPGMFIVIADTAAPSTNSMLAQITSYNSGTGALVVDVKTTLGSGTKTAWTISQTTSPLPLDSSVSSSSLASTLISAMTAETAPAVDDKLMLSDTSEGALNGITLANLLKVTNGLTEDTSPALSTDFLLEYDASAGEAKKVTLENAAKAALNASGSAPIYAARAFVNFNGTGVVAIRAAGNVGSVTDNGVGVWTANLTTALPDANATVQVSGGAIASASTTYSFGVESISTTAIQVMCQSAAGTDSDIPTMCITVHR